MLTQHFTMIGCYYDQGRFIHVKALKFSNNLTDAVVRISNLAGIRTFFKGCGKGLGGIIVIVGIIVVQEEKHRILGQPSRTHVGITLLEGPRTHHISLYQFQDAEKAYAITSSTGPLYEISPSILKPITQGAFYFQDKRLFGMEIKDVVMLEVSTPEENYVLIKQHDDWILEHDPNAPLDQEVVNLFVSRVVDIPTEIAHPEGSTISSQTELDSPTVTIRGRGRQGQKSGLLVLGKREKGLVFAKGAGHKGLYQVRSTILNQIPTQKQLVIKGNTTP